MTECLGLGRADARECNAFGGATLRRSTFVPDSFLNLPKGPA